MQVRAGAPAIDVRLPQQRAQDTVVTRGGRALLLHQSVAALLLPLDGPAAAAEALGAVSTWSAIRQLCRWPRADLHMTSIV